MELKTNLKVGDVCLDCQQQGIQNCLRNFKINLDGDTLLKCQSNKCMYPYNEVMTSSSSSSDEVEVEEEYNGLKLIDDLFQQINQGPAMTNTTNDIQLIEDLIQQKDNKPLEQFEISFLNELEDELKTGNFQNATTLTTTADDSQTTNSVDIKVTPQSNDFLEFLDDKTGITKCKEQLPLSSSYQSAEHCNKDATIEIKQQIFSLPSLDADDGSIQFECVTDNKTKVKIQSIKTIPKTESSNDNLPTTSSKLTNKKSKPRTKTITSAKSVPSSSSSSKALPKPSTSTKSPTQTASIIASTSSQNPVTQTTSSILNDIPKANITGRLLLERLKRFNEKTPSNSLNYKIKHPNAKNKIKKNFKVKEEPPLADDCGDTQDDSDRSLDSISELLKTRKLEKRK